jgi:uncharacterized membrane protein YbhN (UPF0104 family)
VAASVLAYTLSILCRVVRWRILLRHVAVLSFPAVASALVIGFAANNVLPAKLGELVRADCLKRRSGIGRASVLGSIVLERLQDVVIILALLLFGFLGVSERLPEELKSVALWGTVPVAGLLVATLAVSGLHHPFFLRTRPAMAARYRDFRAGLTGIWTVNFPTALLFAALAWSFDLFSLWLVLRSVGVAFGVLGLALLTGVSSLASLLPSGPGYLGTYQLAFALVLTVYGFSVEQAVASACAVQLFFLAPLTLVGGILYLTQQHRNA